MTIEDDDKAPYSLFQASDGKWGVKDKDGNITDKAIYIRQLRDDGDDTFFDGLSEVCGFSPEEGFYPIAYWDPDFFDTI